MNLIPYVSIWAVMTIGVVALALYRMAVASHEDESLHLSPNEARLIAQQIKVSRKIDTIDRWGKILTIVAALYGLLLAAVYLSHVWSESSKLHW